MQVIAVSTAMVACVSFAAGTVGAAKEQATVYLDKSGLRVGVNFEGDGSACALVAIGCASFNNVTNMTAVDFARLRNDAERRAYADALKDIAMMISSVKSSEEHIERGGERIDRGDRGRNVSGDEALRMSFDEPNVFATIDSRDFMFCAAFEHAAILDAAEADAKEIKRLSQEAKTQVNLMGIEVVRAFESCRNGVFQLALIVTWSRREQDLMRDFMANRSTSAGTMRMSEWLRCLEPGEMIGSRHYVDYMGKVWAVGFATASNGQRPFGSNLEKMARDYAAFAMSCDVRAEICETSTHLGNVKKGNVWVTCDTFRGSLPDDQAVYLHRTYVDEATGYPMVVAICALCSDYREKAQEEAVRKITDEHQRQYRKGQQKVIEDRITEGK